VGADRFRDDLGRPLQPIPPAGRIVSLVPSITELIFDLGAGSRLIGITRYCTEPADRVGPIEKLGGTKNPDCARIIEIAPDLVVVDHDENRREDFEALVAAGLTVFVANPHTVAEAARSVERVGALLAAGGAAFDSAAEIRASLATDRSRAAVPVFCPIWRNPWMTFNRSTFAADLIRQAGGENVCQSSETYPEVELAEIAALQPEVVLLPDEPYVFRADHIESLRPLETTPAWRDRRIHLVDGKALFWWGTRTASAIEMVRKLLAPR
jgi:ABC-type hemin transport system substrate-binding protein